MKRNPQVAVLAGLAVLGMGIISPVTAETITVTRGPNGAAHQVKSDRIPEDAQVRSNRPAPGFPDIVTKGPHGAAQIAQSELDRETTAQSAGPLQVVQRGPNGAGHIAN